MFIVVVTGQASKYFNFYHLGGRVDVFEAVENPAQGLGGVLLASFWPLSAESEKNGDRASAKQNTCER